jgi:hypothetical protein
MVNLPSLCVEGRLCPSYIRRRLIRTVGEFQAAGMLGPRWAQLAMIGGVDSMKNVQIALTQ